MIVMMSSLVQDPPHQSRQPPGQQCALSHLQTPNRQGHANDGSLMLWHTCKAQGFPEKCKY